MSRLSGYRQRACWLIIGKLVVGGRSTGDCHSCRDSSSSCRRASAGAVPLKPGAGFKTVSASILRARLGSFCYILLLSFVGVFPLPELIGFQFVSSGKKQVENYILTGPLFKSESIICSCYSDSAHIIQNALFFCSQSNTYINFFNPVPKQFFFHRKFLIYNPMTS